MRRGDLVHRHVGNRQGRDMLFEVRLIMADRHPLALACDLQRLHMPFPFIPSLADGSAGAVRHMLESGEFTLDFDTIGICLVFRGKGLAMALFGSVHISQLPAMA